MEFLYWLESIRNPILDTLMLIFTEFGNELLFIVAGMLMFWCIDKKQGYFILLTGFFGVYINQFLKITCRIPRPWVQDPNFTIVEAAREAATGYSFPSGHTQTAVGCYGALAVCRKEKWVKIVGVVMCLLIPFTRMYLGVHTPWDILMSVAVALGLIFVLWPLFQEYGYQRKLMYPLMGILSVFAVAFLLYVSLYPFPSDIDHANYESALKNSYKFLGCALGMWVIYEVDTRFIKFETKTAKWWAQVIKLAVGFGLLLVVMEGSKPLLNWIFQGSYIVHTVRYFLTVLFAGCVWPLTFKRFAKLGAKKGMTDMQLSPLREADRPAYTALYESSFPASERKELDYMLSGDKVSAYEALVISAPTHPVAGMAITVTHGDLTMLDYFAISPDLRGQGLGHAALSLIRDHVRERGGGHFFLEIETPPPLCIPRDPCANPEQRARRKAFYFSAGMAETGVRAFIYGNDMELLAFPEDVEAVTFEGYDALLRATFPAGMVAERI